MQLFSAATTIFLEKILIFFAHENVKLMYNDFACCCGKFCPHYSCCCWEKMLLLHHLMRFQLCACPPGYGYSGTHSFSSSPYKSQAWEEKQKSINFFREKFLINYIHNVGHKCSHTPVMQCNKRAKFWRGRPESCHTVPANFCHFDFSNKMSRTWSWVDWFKILSHFRK